MLGHQLNLVKTTSTEKNKKLQRSCLVGFLGLTVICGLKTPPTPITVSFGETKLEL